MAAPASDGLSARRRRSRGAGLVPPGTHGGYARGRRRCRAPTVRVRWPARSWSGRSAGVGAASGEPLLVGGGAEDPRVHHAILGVGGIGGLIGGALARAGADVVLIMRAETLAGYGRLGVESVVLGDFEVEVPAVPRLDRAVDVLWVTTKAPSLESALVLAPPEQVGGAVVIPLLNGVDHVAVLRERYANVVAGAIRVEVERAATAHIRQLSPFLLIDLAGADDVAAELQQPRWTHACAPTSSRSSGTSSP